MAVTSCQDTRLSAYHWGMCGQFVHNLLHQEKPGVIVSEWNRKLLFMPDTTMRTQFACMSLVQKFCTEIQNKTFLK